ncbi:zinc metalloprotease HtpX [Roseisolibacter agri]|uniref:Protease HtpX homolog n=1 Tax=Roseisolibacter agri TaxID=2014610 RepID=A0AA37V0A8_9BACT|nr:zinc metalloprotease HtpX [Roseisolibacter agri]GLC24085.1 protease HtpX [Roseisolibacter agri]
MNNVKVFVLMAGLTALLVALGGAFGGSTGATIMVAVSAVMNLAMYWGSSSMVLRAYGAQVVTAAEAPELYAMVDRLRQRAGLPMPTVAIAPQAQPNAFATGRNPENAVVCVTEGLLRLMDREQLEGVVAHELAHIRNRDMLLQTISATMAGAITNVAQFGFLFGGSSDDEEGSNPIVAIGMMILAPIAAMILQMAISRQREFKADQVGAEITGRPLGLANALLRLEQGARQMPMHVSPAMAPLAQVNPLGGSALRGIGKLFSTHPPTAERVARLEAMVR